MSLEESICLLASEIKQLSLLMQKSNELLKKFNEEPRAQKKKLLSEKDAAVYIGMSRAFLAQHRMNGDRVGRTKGPKPTRLGRRVFYEIDELNSWIDENQSCR